MPVIRKTKTAVIDLNESLGKPHNQCPLVHPDANCVPTPTKAPDRISSRFVPKTLVSKGLNYERFFKSIKLTAAELNTRPETIVKEFLKSSSKI